VNRFRADLVLLMVALIWGSAFAVQRVAVQHFDVFIFNGLRFLLGGLVLFPFSKLNPFRKTIRPTVENPARFRTEQILSNIDFKSISFIILAGVILFGAAGLQQAGLATTTAGNAGFITTLYVVLVPIILTVFWMQNIHWLSWLGAAVAVIGSLLLSTGGILHLSSGDALELAGAVLWALHVILVSRAVKHMEVLTFAVGQYFAAGIINILVGFGLKQPLSGLATGWWTILYIGLISTAVGYTLQVLGQKYAPPTDATILLSMEAVFAALAGFIFLEETMEGVQLAGCAMILVAVLITQFKAVQPSSPRV
jgi:drug/metabolite transporter (DMT)-like permease